MFKEEPEFEVPVKTKFIRKLKLILVITAAGFLFTKVFVENFKKIGTEKSQSTKSELFE